MHEWILNALSIGTVSEQIQRG